MRTSTTLKYVDNHIYLFISTITYATDFDHKKNLRYEVSYNLYYRVTQITYFSR